MTTKEGKFEGARVAEPDLQMPEWISLNQALRVLGEGWTPMLESEFRAIATLPLPDLSEAKRILILALARGQLRNRGELWRVQTMRSLNNDTSLEKISPNESIMILKAAKPERLPKLLAKDYHVAHSLWAAHQIRFASSELELPTASVESHHLADDNPATDSYIVKHIFVSRSDVEKLARPIGTTNRGGRPPKTGGLINICAYASAYIHHLGRPAKQASLVEALLEYSVTQLPEHERLKRTTIETIVRVYYRALDAFDK